MAAVGILMVTILVFIGIPVLYVSKIKHPSRSLWRLSACFIVVLYGTPFVAGIILSSLTGVASQGVGYVFQINPQASVVIVSLLITVVAVCVSLPLPYLATKLAMRPLEE